MEKYSSIITSECSMHARFLLCSAFAPLCSEQVSGSVSACRALCETVSEDCKEQLKVLAPDVALDCSAFPLRAVRRLCMRPPNASELEAEPQPPPRWPFHEQELREQDCPPNYVRVPTGECWPACGQPARYSRTEKRTAEIWMDTMAWFSLLSTSFALLTFCAEPSRYRYPERPAVWMAACHAAVAAATAARTRIGGEAAVCEGHGHGLTASCAAFFSVTYFCTLAADAWFATACLAWYLTAASEWSTEALERAAAYLHAVAWGWAGAWTAAALALRRVGADEVTGACSVAPTAAAALVGVPRGALLVAATALALSACPGIARVRRALGARGARRVGRLALRAAASGLLYLLLACAATAAQLIEARGVWTACIPLACGAASGAWAWSRKSAAVWRRALCPPRKVPCCTPPLIRSHHPYQKRPLPVSRV